MARRGMSEMLHHTRDICERLVYKKTTEGTNIEKVATYHSFETAVPGRADNELRCESRTRSTQASNPN